MKCTHEYIYRFSMDSDEMCKHLVNGLCDQNQEFINFIEMFWCDFKGNIWVQVLFSLLAFFIIFKYISITVEEYIADSIQVISSAIGLSDSLAALTLLAFSNGAADVMTVLIASEAEGGISYNIGSLYGGGLFVCSAVVGLCVLQTSNKLKLDKVIIYRIVVFYIIATFITVGFAIYKYITWLGSVCLLVFYLIIVLADIIEGKIRGDTGEDVDISNVPGSYVNAKDRDRDSEVVENHEDQFPSQIGSALLKMHERVVDPSAHKEEFKNRESKKFTLPGRMSYELKTVGEQFSYFYDPRNMTQEFKVKLDFVKEWRRIPAERKEGFGFFIYMIETPFIWILYLTVLPCNREQYSKTRCLMYSIPGMLFNVWITNRSLKWEVYAIGLAAGVALLLFFWIVLDPKEPPKWVFVLTLLSMVGSLMWTYLLVGSMIDLMECIGIVLNLQKTFLGLTILAIGASIPDALTTIHLCKQSESIMAISGAYAGQLFGLTVGFGISMLKLTLKEGPQEFDLFDISKLEENILSILVIFTSLFVLVLTFVYSIKHNFKLGKTFAKFLLVVYVVFISVATYIGVTSAMKTF